VALLRRIAGARMQAAQPLAKPSCCASAVGQAFLECAKLRTGFLTLPGPAMRLSPAEQCRVRDRSTIMARQLYAERGDDFADAQARRPCQR